MCSMTACNGQTQGSLSQRLSDHTVGTVLENDLSAQKWEAYCSLSNKSDMIEIEKM